MMAAWCKALRMCESPNTPQYAQGGCFVVAESDAHVASRIGGQEDMYTIPTNEMLDTPLWHQHRWKVGHNITDYFKTGSILIMPVK